LQRGGISPSLLARDNRCWGLAVSVTLEFQQRNECPQPNCQERVSIIGELLQGWNYRRGAVLTKPLQNLGRFCANVLLTVLEKRDNLRHYRVKVASNSSERSQCENAD
jgi:hypothetical protein